METKFCKKCNQLKDTSCFRKRKHRNNHYSSPCKNCISKQDSIYKKRKRVNEAERERNETENLTDKYVIKLLREVSGLTSKEIRKYPELIEAKRLTLKIKRLCEN